LTTIYNEVGNCLIHNYDKCPFTFKDLIRTMTMNSFGKFYLPSTIRKCFHKYQSSGGIGTVGTKSKIGVGRAQNIYQIVSVNKIKSLQTSFKPKPSRKTSKQYKMHLEKAYKLNQQPIEDFTESQKPAKIFVTDHIYTTASVYKYLAKSILSLSGPNIDRFCRNIIKVADPSCKMTIIEGSRDRSRYIYHMLVANSLLQEIPEFEVKNCLLEHFSEDKCYEYEDLDSRGTWCTMFSTYYSRFRKQALDRKVTKIFIFTLSERGTTKEINSNKIKEFVSSVLGTIFNPGIIFGDETGKVRKFKGDWHYVQLTRTRSINPSRLISMYIYRYMQKQGGNPLTTCMIIYK